MKRTRDARDTHLDHQAQKVGQLFAHDEEVEDVALVCAHVMAGAIAQLPKEQQLGAFARLVDFAATRLGLRVETDIGYGFDD